jgi:hypothetical protein
MKSVAAGPTNVLQEIFARNERTFVFVPKLHTPYGCWLRVYLCTLSLWAAGLCLQTLHSQSISELSLKRFAAFASAAAHIYSFWYRKAVLEFKPLPEIVSVTPPLAEGCVPAAVLLSFYPVYNAAATAADIHSGSRWEGGNAAKQNKSGGACAGSIGGQLGS